MMTYAAFKIRRFDEDRSIGQDFRSFDTEQEAKEYAAKRAGQTTEPYFVVRLIGTEMPIYDPEIGWVPNEDPR